MRARAPGKLVLSGAYAVLRGAPALVSAVDRYVTADSASIAGFATPEVQAGLELLGRAKAPHPSFDPSDLRGEGRKLGLGSSAAILVASLQALVGSEAEFLADPRRLYEICRQAHRQAQGGGSGIDVAASFFGGTLRAELRQGELELLPISLPAGVVFEVWALTSSASTSDFVARVFAQEQTNNEAWRSAFEHQILASHQAAAAVSTGDGAALIRALCSQAQALMALGKASGVPIVVPVAEALSEWVPSSACLLPAGAGGGDVSLYMGAAPSPPEFRRRAKEAGLELLDLSLDAAGARVLA